MEELQNFNVKVPQNGELIDLRHVYAAGQELRAAIGASGTKVEGEFLIRDGQPTSQQHVSEKAVTDLRAVLKELKRILVHHGMMAHLIELSMFDPSDPHLQAFFFALYADSGESIDSYKNEMEENLVRETHSQKDDILRGMLVPNPLLYAFPVIGVKRPTPLNYKAEDKESLFLGIFPGLLPTNTESEASILKAIEDKAVNFLQNVLYKMECKQEGTSSIDTAFLISFPRPAGNGRILDIKLKLRGGSLFVYGKTEESNPDKLKLLGLTISTILARSVMAISQSRAEFIDNQKKLLGWFLHDAPKPLTTIRDYYVPNLQEAAHESQKIMDLCQDLRSLLDFTLANYHGYGFLGSAKLTWDCQTVQITHLIKTILLIGANESGVSFEEELEEINCSVDPQKYMAMLNCLVDNAIKATRQNSGGQRKVQISLKASATTFTTTVSDNGCGFDESDRPKFGRDSFSNFGSTGLGLAIVKGFVELGKGELNMQSRKNEGSSFSITLPLERNL